MITICPQCGQENPREARFCNACGSPLAADGQPGRGVRKTVTVVFCDVVGSTELGERYDPEVLRGMMTRFYAAARAPVERHGGTVEKVIGDALVAVFGIPVVHEDDALRALRAALEMRDAIAALGELSARIGVNTGDVFASDAKLGEALMVGDAVNVAARLEQAAPAGSVLVGQATWALAAHAAHGERVPPIAAKGKSDPLTAWRLDAVDAHAAGHRRRLDLPMVGRSAELGLLRLMVERTRQLARPHLATLIGEPGIGKSRLVAELIRAERDVTVLVGNCRATTSTTLMEPLVEAARSAFPDATDPAAAVAGLMPGDPEAADVAACLSANGSAGVPDIAWAVSRLIGTLSTRGTVLLVLEDVHWADDGLLDAVGQLVHRTGQRSLAVVCTARPEFSERDRGGMGSANAIAIALERLDAEQTRLLLTSASPEMAREQAERVVTASEGNPLFAEHLAVLLDGHDPAAGLPRSIEVLLTARVEALPPAERDVVSVASVAGREFPIAAVESLLQRPVTGEIDRLIERDLIRDTTPGRAQFGHALLQEAAYGLMPKERRGDLHLQLARWIEGQGGSDALVGQQLERAYTLRRELGDEGAETARLGEEAGIRLAAAGRRADAVGDPRRARALLERALSLLPERGPDRAAAMIELGAAGWNLLSVAELRRLLEDGEAMAAALGLRALELRALMLRLGLEPQSPDEVVTDAELYAATAGALGELEQLGDPRALATALCTWAGVEMWDGHSAAAVEAALRAVDALRVGDDDTVWALSILVATVVESPMPLAEAEALFTALLTEFGVRPSVRSELLVGLALVAQLQGREAEAWQLIDTVREIEEDLGRTIGRRLTQDIGTMLVRAGRNADAWETFTPLLASYDLLSEDQSASITRSWMGIAGARAGHLAEARALALKTLDPALRDIPFVSIAQSHQVLAEVLLAEGEAVAAVEAATTAVAVADQSDWVLLRADARHALTRVLAAAGRPDAAAQTAREAGELLAAKGVEL